MSHHHDHEQQLQQQDFVDDEYDIISKMDDLLSMESLFQLDFPQDPSASSSNAVIPVGGGNDINMITPTVKKLNHNANERDRRKRINDLCSSLCSLLPSSSDQKKKSSIATTVSRVVKYIPELQKNVEQLIQKKENLASKAALRLKNDHGHQEKQRDDYTASHSSNISTSVVGDREIVVQMTTAKMHDDKSIHVLLSEVLSKLQEDGFHVMNASSFETFGDQRVFYNIHLQVDVARKMDGTLLSAKLLSYFR